jgi:hypothetical protein
MWLLFSGHFFEHLFKLFRSLIRFGFFGRFDEAGGLFFSLLGFG